MAVLPPHGSLTELVITRQDFQQPSLVTVQQPSLVTVQDICVAFEGSVERRSEERRSVERRQLCYENKHAQTEEEEEGQWTEDLCKEWRSL